MAVKKKKLTPLHKLVQKAQRTFNTWIRTRDKDKCCISCDSFKIEHASHYLSAGQYSALRFNEMNVNGSCAKCNLFLHGNLIMYRRGLVQRYGEQKVLMLENNGIMRQVKKWSRFELDAIIEQYKILS